MNGPLLLSNPTPRLRVSAVVGAGLLLVGLSTLAYYASWSWLPLPALPALPVLQPPASADGTSLPAAFATHAPSYRGVPQVAAALPTPALPPTTGVPLPPTAPVLPSLALPTFPTPPPPPVTSRATPPPARATPAPVKKSPWAYLAKADVPAGAAPQAGLGGVPPDGVPGLAGPAPSSVQGGGAAQGLIQSARWAIPAAPLKTLYRSMLLPGRLLDNIHSDIPGSTIRIELPIPVYDKFHYGHIILDKGSIVIAKQAGQTDFGQQRLPLHIEQIELVSGEIVSVKAAVGDENGASGVPGHVNAHTGKLVLATAINAVLNIGLASAAGTPTGYYQNPAQSAITEAGHSAAQDINTIVRQQLKVPPTIEVKAGQIVSISLEENIQFSKKALVVP